MKPEKISKIMGELGFSPIKFDDMSFMMDIPVYKNGNVYVSQYDMVGGNTNSMINKEVFMICKKSKGHVNYRICDACLLDDLQAMKMIINEM